nr:DUF4282 domain-containing protein [Propionibacterium sp.]
MSNTSDSEPKSTWAPSGRPPVPGSGLPGSAPSAPYPASAPSAPYPPGASGYPPAGPGVPPAAPPYAQAGPSYPPASSAASAPYPQAGYSNQPLAAPFAPAPAVPKTGFAALFDFGFADYATPSIVKIVYALTFAVSVLGWLGVTYVMFGLGSLGSYYGSGNSALGVLTLLFGWVPALLNVATMRLALEFYLVTLRTHHVVNDLKATLAARHDA